MASEEDVKAYQRIVRNTVTQRIIEALKGGEKTLNQLAEAVNKDLPEPLPDLVVSLYMKQLVMEGFVEAKQAGGEVSYTLTDKWKTVEQQSRQ